MVYLNLIVNVSEENLINNGRKWKISVDEEARVVEFGGG